MCALADIKEEQNKIAKLKDICIMMNKTKTTTLLTICLTSTLLFTGCATNSGTEKGVVSNEQDLVIKTDEKTLEAKDVENSEEGKASIINGKAITLDMVSMSMLILIEEDSTLEFVTLEDTENKEVLKSLVVNIYDDGLSFQPAETFEDGTSTPPTIFSTKESKDGNIYDASYVDLNGDTIYFRIQVTKDMDSF